MNTENASSENTENASSVKNDVSENTVNDNKMSNSDFSGKEECVVEYLSQKNLVNSVVNLLMLLMLIDLIIN